MTRPPIVDLLVERRDAHPDATYLRFGDREITWREFAEASFRTANGLAELGVRAGDRVGLMLPNCPEFLFSYLGIVAIGAAPVPINTAQRGGTLAHIVNDSDARAVIVDSAFTAAYADILGQLVDPPQVVVRGDATRLPGAVTLERLLIAPDAVPEIDAAAGSGLGILYTSGTTGPPKGVVATAYDLTPMHRLWGRLGVEPGETVYTALPLFHGNALILSAMGAVYNDWTLALAERFSASRFWADVRRYGAVEFNALGALLPILLKQPERPDDAENPVRTVLSAACPKWAWVEFERRFGVRIVEFFGMVDHPGFLVNDDGTPGAMGRPIGPTEFAVVDSSGAEVGPGEVGELVMRHPEGRITHYHKNPAATEAAYAGGWFHTGDLASVDEDGRYFYRGRLKESMRRRGENISAWEIENVVNTHPGVVESAAHAVSSELGEDDVKLVVVPRPGARLTPQELVDYCDGRMAAYAVPSYVEFRDALPKTGTQRVQYAALKAEGITAATWTRPEASKTRS
jgi:crotonobetaine/carnitine-CoA ligase